MKKIIGVLMGILLIIGLTTALVDQREKVEFEKVIWKTDSGPIEIPWEIEIYFDKSGEFREAIAKSHPEVTWDVIPQLEVAYELPNGKYFLMFDILECQVEFFNGKKYSDRLNLVVTFTESSSEKISQIPQLLLRASGENKLITIKAKLTIDGLLRCTSEDEKEKWLISWGDIKILKVAFLEECFLTK